MSASFFLVYRFDRQAAGVLLLTRVDGICVLVGDLDAELLYYIPVSAMNSYLLCDQELSSALHKGQSPYLLNGHHNLDGVQAVQAQVVGEVCVGLDLY